MKIPIVCLVGASSSAIKIAVKSTIAGKQYRKKVYKIPNALFIKPPNQVLIIVSVKHHR